MPRRAFTLVEVLTVVAIVAVIAAILFPVFGASRRRAAHTTCAGNLRQLGAALVLYANDHEGWVPPATTQTRLYENAPDVVVSRAEVEASPSVLRAAMRTYVPGEDAWFCPADRWRGTDVLYLGQRHRLTSYWYLPIREESLREWPRRMQLGGAWTASATVSEAVPLLADAMGSPQRDSDAQFAGDFCARSNHPDDLVNALRHDLSLFRRRAKFWTKGDDCR